MLETCSLRCTPVSQRDGRHSPARSKQGQQSLTKPMAKDEAEDEAEGTIPGRSDPVSSASPASSGYPQVRNLSWHGRQSALVQPSKNCVPGVAFACCLNALFDRSKTRKFSNAKSSRPGALLTFRFALQHNYPLQSGIENTLQNNTTSQPANTIRTQPESALCKPPHRYAKRLFR